MVVAMDGELADFNVISTRLDDDQSDSDWLDIASNRESDDNDSVSSRDSDVNEPPSLSLSRRSSMSVGSSRDGYTTDTWEGFTDDGSDEGAVQEVGDLVGDGPILSPALDLDNNEEEGEERRLRAALDQSMISTLGSSRTSSHPSTVHNSLRDLRLSFPDPLTSSRDELSSSYDKISSSVQSISPPELVDDPSGETPASPADSVNLMEETEPAKEQGLFPTPVSPSQAKSFIADYTVKLYGTSSAIKWAFVRELLCSSCLQHGFTLTAVNVSLGDAVQWLHFTDAPGTTSLVIRVIDHTLDASLFNDVATLVPSSLGIVYLPCQYIPHPRSNAYFLPVEVPLYEKDLSNVSEFWAERARDHRTLTLRNNGSPVVRYEDLPSLNTSLVHQKMSSMIRVNIRRVGSLFIALLVGVYGAALYAMVIAPTSTPTFSPITTTVSRTFTNVTTSLSIRPSTSMAIVSQAYSLALRPVWNDTPSPIAVTVSASAVDAATTTTITTTPCDCQSVSWTDRMKMSKDLIIAPATASLLSHAPSQLSKTTDTISSLSIRAVDSLSRIMDVTVKALLDSVSRDLRELMEALDDLSRSIGRQTDSLIGASQSASRSMRELIQYRHQRAKGRALELKQWGGRFVSIAGDALIGRTRVARQKAHVLKDHVTTSDAWRTYQKAHGDWSSTLEKKDSAKDGASRRAKHLFGRV